MNLETINRLDFDKMSTYSALYEAIKKLDSKNSEFTEVTNKIYDHLCDVETKMKKYEDEINAMKISNAQQNNNVDCMDTLENKMRTSLSDYITKSNMNNKQNYIDEYYKHFDQHALELKARGMNHKYEYVKKMRDDVQAEGGLLTVPQYDKNIMQYLLEASPLRELCSVHNVSADIVKFPKETKPLDVTLTKGGMKAPHTTDEFGMYEIRIHRATAIVAIPINMEFNTYYDLESFILQRIAEKYNYTEGYVYLLGNGKDQPEGILNNKDIGIVYTDIGSGGFTYDNFVDAQSSLIIPTIPLKPTWLMNRYTRGMALKVKSSTGVPLWDFGSMQNGVPLSILGDPVVIAAYMPNAELNACPVLYGDFRKSYTIIDRGIFGVMKDYNTMFDEGFIKINTYRYLGGQTLRPECMVKMCCATPSKK